MKHCDKYSHNSEEGSSNLSNKGRKRDLNMIADGFEDDLYDQLLPLTFPQCMSRTFEIK